MVRTVSPPTVAKKTVPSTMPMSTLGISRTSVRTSGSRRYTHSAVASPTMSRSSRAAVDSFAGRPRANRPTAIVPPPGIAVLDRPTTSAPTITSTQVAAPRVGYQGGEVGHENRNYQRRPRRVTTVQRRP